MSNWILLITFLNVQLLYLKWMNKNPRPIRCHWRTHTHTRTRKRNNYIHRIEPNYYLLMDINFRLVPFVVSSPRHTTNHIGLCILNTVLHTGMSWVLLCITGVLPFILFVFIACSRELWFKITHITLIYIKWVYLVWRMWHFASKWEVTHNKVLPQNVICARTQNSHRIIRNKFEWKCQMWYLFAEN